MSFIKQFFQPKNDTFFKVVAGTALGIMLLGAGFMGGLFYNIRSTTQPTPSPTSRPAQANTSLPADFDFAEIEALYDFVRDNFDGTLEINDLLVHLKKGLVKATGDPYTDYLSTEEATSFKDSILGRLIGIGVYLELIDGHIGIVSPLKGYPAEQAGLHSKDIILEIDGESTLDMSLTQAANKIRGEEGTNVTLTISRNSGTPFQVTITRAVINVPSATYEIKDGFGILTLIQFTPADVDVEGTLQQALKAAQAFKRANVKGVVLDLRSNPGGDLYTCLDVAGLWLAPQQVVLETVFDNQLVDQLKTPARTSQALAGLPLVMLINSGSASASEILAGALKHYEVGTVVGETSFGKTSIQDILNLQSGESLRLTTHHWRTPGGVELDDGLQPDVVIADDTETEDVDEQLNKALAILRGN